MKKVLGLDLGTTSIGWALVNRAETKEERSNIIKLGVRVVPLSVDENLNYGKGKPITTNAGRRLKRGMRRNLQRYKLRRENLIEILKDNKFITDDTFLSEEGKDTTFETYTLRAKAVTDEIALDELARVLLMINKKRGYRSGRKVTNDEDGQSVDSMEVAKNLYQDNLTPGEFSLNLLKQGKKELPDYYRTDLKAEIDKIWEYQREYHSEILTDELKIQLEGKGQKAAAQLFFAKYGFNTADVKGSKEAQKLKKYELRVDALTKELDKEELALVISNICGEINSSSGYLAAISDRSKELEFNNQTVGQYFMEQLAKNSHFSVKNKIFYRQDYIDEFEKIWSTQSKFHTELTNELKSKIRDVIIFYQRRLKSQKGLISFCEFERREVEIEIDGKIKEKVVGSRVVPKSSPLFQEFKIWQILNNIQVTTHKQTGEYFELEQDQKEYLAQELSIRTKLSATEALKLLYPKEDKDYDLNYNILEGNKTQAELFDVYKKIIVESNRLSDHDFSKMNAKQTIEAVAEIFDDLGYSTDILEFDSSYEGDIRQQPMYKLWHILYSYEGDSGNEKLEKKLTDLYGFAQETAKRIANISFSLDYGNLSAKAIKKILPFLKSGSRYDESVEKGGYDRHSKSSLTKEEIDNKILKDKLKNLPKNYLRNPVVEKILNQMVNVVNAIIDTYGKPDEISVELARELKMNAKERENKTKAISKSNKNNEAIKKRLKDEFSISNVSHNDILRYKLYQELKDNAYKTLYSNQYIPQEKLFSKEIDRDHIIPQSRLFDDSFSNKILEYKSVNIEKGNETAYDYVLNKYGKEKIDDYLSKINKLYANKSISKTKYNKLKMKGIDIPDDFIERDIKDTQYIAKTAKNMLEEIVNVVISTSGEITSKLREDWGLVDIMKELNWDKYSKLGLTEVIENEEGHKISKIKDWNKRNDHRHHAMDALTVAFTTRSHIQHLNTLKSNSESDLIYKDKRNKKKFSPPIPEKDFRAEAKEHLENTLISIKAKNKVATINTNKTKTNTKNNFKETKQLTPRGQLHNETIYGSIQQNIVVFEKIGSSFDADKINKVTKPAYKEALLERLHKFNDDPKLAFTVKNSLSKNPIYLNDLQTNKVPEKVKIEKIETIYTIRKDIKPDLNVEKVVDSKIRKLLEKRIKEYNNDPKKAFENLDENPIWLNEKKCISIKRVTIRGVSNTEPLHSKKDKDGKLLLDGSGQNIPIDFVQTGNNHHVAMYKDQDGDLQENVVSFYEAVLRKNDKLPIMDKNFNSELGWQFMFSMEQNEYFIFPNEQTRFNPNEIDLLEPNNYHLISPNLYRVQKLATKNYMFRHHLETDVQERKELKGISYKLIQSTKYLEDIVKVRTNHLGQIISVGEY
ncbi:MAG: type II CRISPR RNA-guided endonuclease Cas9 [Ignavibacteria bacterium]|jgi:CRISPR-associated endonuclease Csn1|nr:type II CRISPR RNA-guided endonuclease Cas9 [Ignavibacteria bacterium]